MKNGLGHVHTLFESPLLKWFREVKTVLIHGTLVVSGKPRRNHLTSTLRDIHRYVSIDYRMRRVKEVVVQMIKRFLCSNRASMKSKR